MSIILHRVQDTCAPQSAVHPFNHPPIHSLIHPSVPLFFRLSSRGNLPLLPAEIITPSKYHKKAKDGEEDDSVSCHHETTGTPLDCAMAG